MTHLPDESSVRATGFLKKRRTGRTDPHGCCGRTQRQPSGQSEASAAVRANTAGSAPASIAKTRTVATT
jgi:hypothetical protein